MDLNEFKKQVINVYGTEDLWKNAKTIEAEVSVTGLLFLMKKRTYFDHAKIQMQINTPFSKITPIGKDKDITGVLSGQDVWLEKNNEKICKRKNARTYFSSIKKLFFWDDLDMSYFANYAFWNYFVFPKLLTDKKIKWIKKGDYCLEAEFPKEYPTHSVKQQFYFNKDFTLREHCYVAEVVSRFADATHIVFQHNKNKKGIIYESRKKVFPKITKMFKFPTLIDIKVHKFEIK